MIPKHYNVTPYAAGGLEEEKVPPICFLWTGPGVVVCGNRQTIRFPASMARGATLILSWRNGWDTASAGRPGRSEAICLPVSALTCPIIRVWGRSQETYGRRKPIRLTDGSGAGKRRAG